MLPCSSGNIGGIAAWPGHALFTPGFNLTKVLLTYTVQGLYYQKERRGLLEYKFMPSFRDVAHDGVLCTFSNRSAPDRDKWCGPSGQAVLTADLVQNHTVLGHSPPAA